MLKRLAVLIGAGLLISAPSVMAQNLDLEAIVAIVDGEHIALKDLDVYSRKADPRRLFLLNQQLQESRGLFDRLSDERLIEAEAARAGTTVSELLNERLRVEPVTDAEILQAFKRIRERQPGLTYKQMLPVLRPYLQGQHKADARAKFIRELKQAAR